MSEQQISADTDKIKDYYLGKGYNQVQVSYKIDTNEEFGRSVVTFIISEGDRAYVTEVDFVGNDHLTTKELRKIMKTRKKNFFSFINKSGLFKEDDFKQDLDNLRTYYNSKGYIDMEVKDVKYEYPAKGQMKVTITVFEGIQYTVGKIDFDGNTIFTKQRTAHLPRATQRSSAWTKARSTRPAPTRPTRRSRTRNCPTLENDIKRIRDLYGTRGYIDMQLTPERQANVESGKIDILYHIVENSQSYVEQIIIQGNNRTKDKVIRRELLVAPGQIYDSVRADVEQEAPGKSPVLREGRHLAPGHHRAQPQEHGRHGRGKAHRLGHLRRRLQLGRQPARLCRNHPGQLRPLQLPLLHRRRRKIPRPPPVRS